MNIQINCKDNVDKDDLLYIYYNLQDYIKEYQENKDDNFQYSYINGKKRYYKKLKGNWSMSTNIDMICTQKTIYFKIKGRNK